MMGDNTGTPLNGGPSPPNGLTPELLYKMNKKIAQLTKVVYGLNTRGEELEAQLNQAKEAEEALREANGDLQRRASLYKNKLDADTNGVGEANFYKMECDSLKRRLEEVNYTAGASVLRDELEQSRRREKALSYELDQARHSVSNMKGHHDFVLRDRDSREIRDTEKREREWETRTSEMETRYQVQVRRLTDDLDACRRRAQAAAEDKTLRDQLTMDREREKRDWELKLQLKKHELDEERVKNCQDKRDKETKIRQLSESRRKEGDEWEERIRSTNKVLEDRLKEAQEQRSELARSLESREAEFETRLKSKITEWKMQWDAVEDGLQAEIQRLKAEKAVLHSNQTIAVDTKIEELQAVLQQKDIECDLQQRNLQIRISVTEAEAKNSLEDIKNLDKQLKEEKEKFRQQNHRTDSQIEALERHLREETERHQYTKTKLDNFNAKVKVEMEEQLKHLQDSEKSLKEEKSNLAQELTSLKVQFDASTNKAKEKEKELQELLDKEVKAAEAKVKSKIEKSWLDKLKRSEETAAQDIEKIRDSHRRVEGDLKKDITLLQKGELEAKRLNEEFKKKVRQLRQSETELQQRLADAESFRRERSVSRSASSSLVANNLQEMTTKHNKELSTLESRHQEQVDKLTKDLEHNQQQLATSKLDAVNLIKKSDERLKKEQEELLQRLEKEKKEIEEQFREKLKEKEKEHEDELQKTREEEVNKYIETQKISNDEKTKTEEDAADSSEEEESEAETNKRKYEKLQTELLILKQQNDEFEDMVREKHRRQMELELQVGEVQQELATRQSAIDTVKTELCYAKNESSLCRARVKKLEDELQEYKDKAEKLEDDLDASQRELKRMEILQDKLCATESKRNDLQTQLDGVEDERDEEIKIIQDALDEAAQEREELLVTFEKEMEKLNSVNAAREAQMLEDFEDKLRTLEKQHKQKLDEKEKQSGSTFHRAKRTPDEEEIRQRLDKMKSELNSEWEDKLRVECARLKGELDGLHAEERHLAVESVRVQKEQEIQTVRQTYEARAEEVSKEVAKMKESLSTKDSLYHKELEELRTRADRDIWELRRKMQKLDESSYDRQQYLEDKNRVDLERLREDYADKMASLEAQLSSCDVGGTANLRATLEKRHKEQMEHLEEQHRLSMERLRDELESEKFQAAEDARVIVTKHHEYLNSSLTEQLTEAVTANTQYHDEIDAIRYALSRREEVIRLLEEDLAKLKSSGVTSPSSPTSSPVAGAGAMSFTHEGSQGSRVSQDRLSTDDDDGHKGSGLLGKVFGGGWFSGQKNKEGPSGSSAATPAKRGRQPS